MNKKQVIILMGPPGAGKGTQAGLLADKFDLYYLETSKIIERKIMGGRERDFEVVEGKKYYFSEERKKWKTGEITSPPLVASWVVDKIKKVAKEEGGLILAGSPRTVEEGKKVIPLLKRLYGKENIKVILIKVSAQESIFRNSHRRICELIRHPILYNKETVRLARCPLDGSKLMKRKGLDAPEVIRKRIKTYKEKTHPLVEYFRKKERLCVKEISGSGPVAKAFKKISKMI